MLRLSVRRLPVALLLPLSLACSGANESGSSPAMDASMSVAASPAPAAMARESKMADQSAVAGVADATGQIKTEGTAPTIPSMIIRNGTASVQVDSLELAILAVQNMAKAFGGFVGNTSLSSGEFELRSATIELKIPSARFEDALAGLKPIGKVESVSSTAEDVGEEFVDVSARVANARRLEERLITLLATRTGKLEDVLAVERELARVREEIERYEGRIRFLKTRVAISTLTVTVHEKAPLVSATPGENILLNAFKDAWRNFVRFVAGFISMLGVIIPTIALVVLVIFGWRRWRK